MIKNQNKIIGIIPAAGIGERFGSKTPKQYFRLDSNTIIEKTIDIFINLAGNFSTFPNILSAYG